MDPLLNWAILLFVSSGFFWYYRTSSRPRAGPAFFKPAPERHENGSATKKAKRKAKHNTSSSGSPNPPSRPFEQVHEKPKVVAPGEELPEEGMDNKEFARPLAKAKEGAKLPHTNNKSKEIRTKKISASGDESDNKDATELSTCTSSSTGADADDDLSSMNSPVVNPARPVAGDVSDMLEAGPGGLSCFRLVITPQQEQAPRKKQKTQDTGETKKQRQRRLKNENRKLMVQEAEKERRIQLEKQLHGAREHERREAAKAKPPTMNAWRNGALSNQTNDQTNGISKTTIPPPTALLDTFDPTPQSADKLEASSENSRPSSYMDNWTNNLPSEEEQMRIILSENEWTTVSSRKKERKNGSKRTESVSEESSSDFLAAKDSEPSIAPTTTTTTTTAPSVAEQFEVFSGKGHPLDSDWDP
ncbi:hypothetical protein PABG_00410 [Paracoccidioides brasiliensis Pb03]|nr:hypothetical protein PABG_00410 [Paracoccidioides brasiliensis Pb03]